MSLKMIHHAISRSITIVPDQNTITPISHTDLPLSPQNIFLRILFQKEIEIYICSDCYFTPFTCDFHCFVFTIPLRIVTTEQGVLQVIIFDIFACLCLGWIAELGMHNEHFTQVKFISVLRFRCFVC